MGVCTVRVVLSIGLGPLKDGKSNFHSLELWGLHGFIQLRAHYEHIDKKKPSSASKGTLQHHSTEVSKAKVGRNNDNKLDMPIDIDHKRIIAIYNATYYSVIRISIVQAINGNTRVANSSVQRYVYNIFSVTSDWAKINFIFNVQKSESSRNYGIVLSTTPVLYSVVKSSFTTSG